MNHPYIFQFSTMLRELLWSVSILHVFASIELASFLLVL